MSQKLARLWVVATPLGNAEDLSPRARRILGEVDCILAEDTRRAKQLCALCGIKPPLILSFFEHNEEEREGEVLGRLRAGQSLALISDAGTPLLADPGYRLVRACRKEGLIVSPIPGPSAPICALSSAGLPPIPYTFLGFLPREAAAQTKLFQTFAVVPGSLVFFERSDRLKASLERAYAVLGARELTICRELTKLHEEFMLLDLEAYAQLPSFLGELTIILGPGEAKSKTPQAEVKAKLALALERGGKLRSVLKEVQFDVEGWSSKELYALALQLKIT